MKEYRYATICSYLKYLGIFLIFCALSYAEIGGMRCFGMGMFFAMVWCNQKLQIVAPLYILSNLICFGNYISVIGSVITVVIMSIMYVLHYKCKKPMNLILITLYALASVLANTYLSMYAGGVLIDSVLGGVLGLIAMWCYIYFLQNIMMYGVRRKYQVAEVISGGVMWMLIVNGVYNVPFLGVYLVDVLCSVAILVGMWCFGTGASVMLGIIGGLGVALSTGSLIYVAIYGILGMVAGAMRSNYRIYSVLSVFLVNVLLRFYFLPIGSMYEHLAMLVGCVLFWLLPKQVLEVISNMVINERESNAITNLLNKERAGLYSKLKN